MTSATGLAATVDVGPSLIDSGSTIRIGLLTGSEPAQLAAARRVALAACADVVVTLRADDRLSLIERATALRDARPDALLLAADGGAEDLIEAIRLAYGSGAHPLVLVSAGDRARERYAAALAGFAPQSAPAATAPYGRDALVAQLRAARRTGEGSLRDEALEAAARSLAITTARSVTVVDVGSAVTTIAHAAADGASTAASAFVGVGSSADRVVSGTGLDRVRRWIPRAVDAPAILDRVFNRARWPDVAPATPMVLALEMAIARESIAHVLAELAASGVDLAPIRAAKTIVLTGALTRWPAPQQAVMTIIDALEPSAVHAIVRDDADALVAAASRSQRADAAVTANLRAVAIVTAMWPKRSHQVSVSDASGPVDAKVIRGALLLVPTSGDVDVRVNDKVEATATDLELGVVFDARGRPLVVPPRDAERLPTLARWWTALGVLPELTS